MDANRIDRLSARHKDVLRLYHRRLRAKEIGAELGISENTVSSYLTEAASILDVGGRRAAAQLFADTEATHLKLMPEESVGDGASRMVVSDIGNGRSRRESAQPWWTLLPFPTSRGATNNLSPAARLGWIAGITFMTTVTVLLFIATGAALKQLN